MAENVFYLHAHPEPIRHYLRLGTSGHRQLEALLASGQMPVESIVVEAAAFERQSDLVTALREDGRELILDPNTAELSAIGRCSGVAKSAPWAMSDGVLKPEHFIQGSNQDVIGSIARFTVRNRFHAVHAPTHFLNDSTDPWFVTDRESCSALRKALDAEGGKGIAIDYVLTISYASLRDPVQRRAFIAGLSNLPFENLWLRVSGFGADASPMGVRRYIAAVMDFQRVGRPIIADGVGGLAALAIGAFGATGGVAHGVSEKERFDASDWHRPPRSSGGGREKRLLVSGLDRLLSVKQIATLMAAPGARRLLSCSDSSCCAHGYDDTLKNPKGHYLYQRTKQLMRLSKVPESLRARDFLDVDLASAARTARQAAKLKVADEKLGDLLHRTSERMERMQAVLADLHKTVGNAARSATPRRRRGGSSASASRSR